jgi:Type I phosphodiesterase / nucleotide pyrophosphatase
MMMRRTLVGMCAFALSVAFAPVSDAGRGHRSGSGLGGRGGGESHNDGSGIRHVLLLSIDGMHVLDFTNCAKGLSGVNGGDPYCPNLAALAAHGVNYLDTSASKPSDSFPGLMAIVTGGSPRTVGAFYDVAYDRSLQPPALATGNHLAAGSCTPGQTPTGTSTEYEEGIDIDQSQLNGGAPSGDGGANSIDPRRLPRDPNHDCAPVFPHDFVRVNTIFGVVKAAGRYTAWSDKHPAYEAVNGPGDGHNVDDFFGPEINSVSVDMPQVKIRSCNPLPDNAAKLAGDDYTGSFQNIQCYDSLKVQAILNEIDRKTHDGSSRAPVPAVFGMNFQAVSVGQKLVYQHGSVAAGFSVTGGYTDAIGTPSASLLQEIEFVDNAIGMMVSELQSQGVYDSTLIVISAKHGQSPIDPGRLERIHGDLTTGKSPATILDASLPASEAPSGGQIGATEDDVSLLWLKDSSQTGDAVSMLQSASPPMANIAGIGEIFWGPAIGTMFDLPGLPPNGDPRTPDIVITTNIGVTYTGGQKKVMEHGGFARDDTNVMMLLANPGFAPATVTAPVETAQIAPTILRALGLDPHRLQAVQIEHTQSLPGIHL